MENLRKRNPFTSSEDDPSESTVMDEQEQEELIHDLRRENARANDQYLLGLRVLLGLSCTLDLIALLRPKRPNPLAIFFSAAPDSPIPGSFLLAILSLMVHLNLMLLISPRLALPEAISLRPAPYQSAFAASAIAPLVALISGGGWVTFLWWSLPGVMVGLTFTIQKWIAEGEARISELEKLKYTAPGA